MAPCQLVSADDRFVLCAPCVAAWYSFLPNLRSHGSCQCCVGVVLCGQFHSGRPVGSYSLWSKRLGLSSVERLKDSAVVFGLKQTDSSSALHWAKPFAGGVWEFPIAPGRGCPLPKCTAFGRSPVSPCCPQKESTPCTRALISSVYICMRLEQRWVFHPSPPPRFGVTALARSLS